MEVFNPMLMLRYFWVIVSSSNMSDPKRTVQYCIFHEAQ